jgi:hypothetical protein
MVGTKERCLRKVLGQSSLTEELNTTLISNKDAVKSRPITQCGDYEALTPAHFKRDLVTIPTEPEPETRNDLARDFRLRLKI